MSATMSRPIRCWPDSTRSSSGRLATAAGAAVQAGEAVLREATSTYERQKALLVRGYTTKREHDQAQEAFRTTQAALDTAQASARHRPRPAFRHGSAGGRSRRRDGPQG